MAFEAEDLKAARAMGLQFFHGYLLWGLGLFLLPILIHLLRRRRIQTFRLPTFEFLMRTQRRIARRSQLKNWLLLALRISAVTVVAVLAARPLLSKQGWSVGSSWSPIHLAVVVDNSASMSFRTSNGTRFELAKRAAERLIGGLSTRDKVSIWATAERESKNSFSVMEKEAALLRLASIQPSDAAGQPFRTIQKVMAGMISDVDRQSVIVLSDMARSDWEELGIRSLRRIKPHTRIQFVHIAPEAGTHDIVVQNVRLRPWPPKGNAPFAVVSRIVNQGNDEKKNIRASLYVDEKRMGETEMALKGWEEKEVSFRVRAPESGIFRGRIELTPDNLDSTNRHYFAAEMGSRNRVLVIDGDPKRGLIESESFYISNALSAAPPGGSSPLNVEVVADYETGSVEWESYDLIIACNVGKWSPQTTESLRRFVERGGGFIWATGSLAGQTVPGEGWLPALPDTAQVVKPSQGTAIPPDSWSHPVFTRLGSNPSRLFSKTRVRRMTPLKGVGNGKALLTLQDGRPILVVGRAGSGKIAVWGSTCDREWTDIPVRPVFVPFIRGLVDFLGGKAEGTVAGIQAGESIKVTAKAHRIGEAVQIRSPSGAEETLRLEQEQDDARQVSESGSQPKTEGRAVVANFAGTFRAGFYEIRKPDGVEVVAANFPRSETVLEPLGEAELRERLPGLDLAFRSIQADDSKPVSSIEGWMDLGILIFVFFGMILVFEGVVADRS